MCERDVIANLLRDHGYQMREDEDPVSAIDRAMLRQRTALLAMQQSLNIRASATTDAVVRANTKDRSTPSPNWPEALRAWGVVAIVYLLVTVIGVACISWAVSTIARWFA